jgi:hypothetical protein
VALAASAAVCRASSQSEQAEFLGIMPYLQRNTAVRVDVLRGTGHDDPLDGRQ